MKLRLVAAETMNFTSSERTNVDELVKRKKLALEPNHAVALFSMTGEQCILVRAPSDIELSGYKRRCYVSVRFRLDGGSWWQNLTTFFRECEKFGLDVTGLQTQVLGHAEETGHHVERKLRAVR